MRIVEKDYLEKITKAYYRVLKASYVLKYKNLFARPKIFDASMPNTEYNPNNEEFKYVYRVINDKYQGPHNPEHWQDKEDYEKFCLLSELDRPTPLEPEAGFDKFDILEMLTNKSMISAFEQAGDAFGYYNDAQWNLLSKNGFRLCRIKARQINRGKQHASIIPL